LTSLLLILWIIVGAVHLGIPLGYFGVMRRLGARRDYGVKQSPIEPQVTIIIPTYNEEAVIVKKLVNLVESDYPSDKLEIIVTDGGSNDRTVELAREFIEQKGLVGRVFTHRERRGKSYDVNLGLAAAKYDLICLSDAECMWNREALRNALKYMADPAVGSVTGVHLIERPGETLSHNIEGSYRGVYRMLRIAESKLHSTPVAEAEIQVFRHGDIKEVDPRVGADDTCIALCVVDKGLRAIAAENVLFYDPTPPTWYSRFRQKFRRGQHILQAFLKHRGLIFGRGIFSKLIFPMEFFMYVLNPIIFPSFLFLTGWVMITNLFLAMLVAAGLLIVVLVPSLRTSLTTHVTNNLIMLTALIQEARGEKHLVWTKIDETRVADDKTEIPLINN
jgi:cellulose synthase/poly-beta-1,6-N-acetylglucosamine synthase-like glycosyltransferase